MTQAGFTISGSAHPICPVMLGDARLASVMADDMLQLGEAAAGTESSIHRTVTSSENVLLYGLRRDQGRNIDLDYVP